MSQVLAATGGAWPLAWCAAVVFGAYALRGATGFGAGVVAIPLLLLALPLPVVIPLVTAMGMVASLGQAVHQRHHVDGRALARLVAPTLAGVAAGLWLFAALDARVLLRALGLFIIVYALGHYTPWKPVAPGSVLAPLAGAVGGLVATLFGGMAGPFYVVYLRTLGLDKTRFRATIALALFLLGVVRAAGYGGLGLYDKPVLLLLTLLLPVVGIAMLAGDRLHARLDERRFGHVVSALLVASAAALLVK